MVVSKKLISFAMLVLFTGVANANLIVNGGFEINKVGENKWSWFNSDDVQGWRGSNIEIWNSLQGVHAVEGENHAELNAHANSGAVFRIYQLFITEIGKRYDLSFAYRARRNSNEAFSVFVETGGTGVFDEVFDDHTTAGWSTFNGSFTSNGTKSLLRFTSITPTTGTVGNFIDAISITESVTRISTTSATQASAPGALMFMLVGMGLLSARRFSK
jgi:hypothetical protein